MTFAPAPLMSVRRSPSLTAWSETFPLCPRIENGTHNPAAPAIHIRIKLRRSDEANMYRLVLRYLRGRCSFGRNQLRQQISRIVVHVDPRVTESVAAGP